MSSSRQPCARPCAERSRTAADARTSGMSVTAAAMCLAWCAIPLMACEESSFSLSSSITSPASSTASEATWPTAAAACFARDTVLLTPAAGRLESHLIKTEAGDRLLACFSARSFSWRERARS